MPRNVDINFIRETIVAFRIRLASLERACYDVIGLCTSHGRSQLNKESLPAGARLITPLSADFLLNVKTTITSQRGIELHETFLIYNVDSKVSDVISQSARRGNVA